MNIKRFNGNDFPGDKWVRDILSRVNEIIDYLKRKVGFDRLSDEVTEVLAPLTSVGTDGQVLTSDGTAADWEDLPVASASQRGVLDLTSTFVANGSRYGLLPPRTPQVDLTVTGTGWTTLRAKGFAYSDVNGVWRLKFNIAGTTTSGARTSYGVSISGVTFAYVQSISGHSNGTLALHNMFVNTPSNIVITHASGTTSSYAFSGDVELSSKPSWA